MPGPLYFSDEYIRKLLVEESITLSEAESRIYIPRFVALIEEKLGGVLMEKLTDDQLTEFEKLFSDTQTTGEQWEIFWNKSIPHFSLFVEEYLHSCTTELKGLLKNNV